MRDTSPSAASSRYQTVSWVLTGIALLAVLQLHLVPALLAGLLAFQLVHSLSGALHIPYLTSRNAKILLVALLAMIVVALLVLAGIGIVIFLRRGPDNLAHLLTQLAAIVEDLRRLLPAGLVEHLPSENRDVRVLISGWFREHAAELRTLGTDTLRAFVHILIGLILGGMIALYEVTPHVRQSPFLSALQARTALLAGAFRRILLAQLPISAINTALTALYLMVVLPAFDVHLPFAKTLITVTFIAGLLPVLGNLISNTVIFLVSLSLSFSVAMAALGYLVVIHKLEYFLNARIVGTRIDAHAWELLLAMLVLESAYGIAGLIAAPVCYAYLKSELAVQGLLGKPPSPPANAPDRRS
jgi:predicted PurR-regulated permease PerM